MHKFYVPKDSILFSALDKELNSRNRLWELIIGHLSIFSYNKVLVLCERESGLSAFKFLCPNNQILNKVHLSTQHEFDLMDNDYTLVVVLHAKSSQYILCCKELFVFLKSERMNFVLDVQTQTANQKLSVRNTLQSILRR